MLLHRPTQHLCSGNVHAWPLLTPPSRCGAVQLPARACLRPKPSVALFPYRLSSCSSSSSSRTSVRRAPQPPAASKPTMVLESQPMLSDLLTEFTGPLETIVWKATLDIVLPIMCLWLLLKVVDWAADQSRVIIDARVAGDSDVGEELRRRSTIFGLVLLAMRTPAKFMLPPWLLAYTLRTALNITDLVVNKYRSQLQLPKFVDFSVQQVSSQLVPLDAALQRLLAVSGVLFVTWFVVQLKDILIREVILVRAIRSGNKELERVYLPLSSLVTWGAVLCAGLAVCASLDINLKPLLAVGGAGGIAAGFASQQVLLNIVAGVNIFLTRPFIAGDQVVFAGGANLEGTVEGVEITRTLLRTADGTLVALPNKLISDLIVYNRTRSIEAAPNTNAAVAAAPLRRVLCFTIQLDRGLEPQLDAIRSDVVGLLNQITRQQLVSAGLTPEPPEVEEEPEEEAESASAADGDDGGEGSSSSKSSSSSRPGSRGGSSKPSSRSASPSRRERPSSPVAAAAAAAAAVVAEAVAVLEDHTRHNHKSIRQQQEDDEALLTAADAATFAEEGSSSPSSPEPEPLAVSITLQQLTGSTISLFVRCELLLPPSSSGCMNAMEQQTESTLIAISGLVKDKYGAVLLWQ